MKTKYRYIITLAALLFGIHHNIKLYAQVPGTSFEKADKMGTFSGFFDFRELTRGTTLEDNKRMFVHEELNYVFYDELSGEPAKDFQGEGPAMYFKFKIECPMALMVKTSDIPSNMNGVYMHVAVRRKKKYYVIYSCLGKGTLPLDIITQLHPELLYNGGLNLDVSLTLHPDEYYIIISGMGIRPASVNHGYMHVSFTGIPIPPENQPSANFLPSLDPNVVPVKPEGVENISAIDDTAIESLKELNLSKEIPYIYSRTYTSQDSSKYIENIKYYDGLGRVKQVVDRNITPTFKDLVRVYDYDGKDRIVREWLPVRVPGNNEGSYVARHEDHASGYYRDSAYVDMIYEDLYVDRGVKVYAPGATYKDWDIPSEKKNLFNKGITGYLSCIMFKAANQMNTTISKKGYYSDGELHVSKEMDEDGNVSYTFYDKSDRFMLMRQINDKKAFDTYYVYDDFGNCRAVLPPMATDEIIKDPSELDTGSPTVKNLAYLYMYDSYNRCIAKKLPGCDWIYYIYDMADQLIFTQDGELRKKGEWAFTIPDALGRTVLTGVCKNTLNYTADPLRAIVLKAAWGKVTNTYKGYTVTGISLTTPTVLSASYYDNYEFMGLNSIPANTDVNFKYNAESGYGTWYGTDYTHANKYKNKGMLTGNLTAQMNTDGTVSSAYLYSVIYYDDRGRLIQSKSNNHLKGLEKEYFEYNYTGQPVKRKHVHQVTGKNTQTEVYAYTYDHAGRLLKTTHQLTDGTTVKPQVTLAENTYDELGRLKTNKKGGQANLNTTYAYNVRSWASGITSHHFNQALTYSYNGNISCMQWGQAGKTRKYNFTYDNLSRLKTAAYTGDGNFNTLYTYDKHGNIKTLQRYGMTAASTYGIIDNLTAEHTGNQLKYITDAGPNVTLNASMDFKDYTKGTGIEYTYNANGAMVKDLNKGISAIAYNSLNLPRIVDIKSKIAEGRNEYIYSASGQKLKAVQRWNPNYNSAPVIGSDVNISALTVSSTTDYVDNIIYENGKLKRILVDGGYYENGNYYFYINDHLGNNRIVANAAASVVQSTQYYPFGMPFADVTGAGVQPYKYNGKELDQMHGLNLYDYSARYYESAVGRFTTVDPLAEKYYSISPYAYCANNPIKFIDPDGKQTIDPPIGGSPENLRRAAVNQDIERLKVLAAKPAALGLALSLSLPVNLVNTIGAGIEIVFFNKGPKEGTVAIYGTLDKTTGLPDVGGSGSFNLYQVQGDERLLDENAIAGQSTEKTASLSVSGAVGINVNKSEAKLDNNGKIIGQGLGIGFGKSLSVTGKDGEKTTYLFGSFNIYDNNNEKYNPNESTNDYYIRRYTNLNEYEKAIK